MTSAEDLTGKIVICTESIQGFKSEFASLLEDLVSGPPSHLNVFFHLLSAILTSEDESPMNRFYGLYLILKVSESNPTREFILELADQDKLIYEIQKAAQYDSGAGIPLNDKGKTFFSKAPSTPEANIGVNYVRLCIETSIYWGDTFGKSNNLDPLHSLWVNKEVLSKKLTLPQTFWFIGKDYYGNEEVASWNFAKEDLPSLPMKSRAHYQEGKGLVQNLVEGDSKIQVIVAPNLNSLSPEKGSVVKDNTGMQESGHLKKASSIEDSMSHQKVQSPSFPEQGTPGNQASPNSHKRLGSSPEDLTRKKVSFNVIKEEAPAVEVKEKTQFKDMQDKIRYEERFEKREDFSIASLEGQSKQVGPNAQAEYRPGNTKTGNEPTGFAGKKATLGTKMAELGMFADDKKASSSAKDTGLNRKSEVGARKDIEGRPASTKAQDIRNFFNEREKAQAQAKANSAKVMQIPETEFRGPVENVNLIDSPEKSHPEEAKSASSHHVVKSSYVSEQPKEQSPLLLVENEQHIDHENQYLRSEIQKRQQELERTLPSEEMSRQHDQLNDEMERLKEASQLKVGRHDSLVKENTFLKSKLFEFEQKLKEMNNKINMLYNENKRLTGHVDYGDDGFENPLVKKLSTPSPRNAQSSRGGSYVEQQRLSEKPGHGHVLRSTPPPEGMSKQAALEVRNSHENLAPPTQAGKKKIFELVNYEKPRMVLTAKDFSG